MVAPSRLPLLFTLVVLFAVPSIGSMDESEPNDSVAAANPIAVGATVSASLAVPGDQDFFSIELAAGRGIEIILDRPANSGLIWTLQLIDRDGVTSLALNEPYSSGYAPLGKIWHAVSAGGRYFVRVTASQGTGSAGSHPYSVRTRAFSFVAEREDNGTAAGATPASLGDTLSGAIPAGDVDLFALDLPAGTPLKLDVLTGSVSCHFWPSIRLLAPDGQTVVDSPTVTQPSHFTFRVPIATGGRHYVAIQRRHFEPRTPNCYFIGVGTFEAPSAGPGQPITTLGSDLSETTSLTANRDGQIFFAGGYCDTELPSHSQTPRPVSRLTADGSASTVASDLIVVGPIAFDGFGDLLVPTVESSTSSRGTVWRISPSGQRSVFVGDVTSPCGLGVSSDGDVWIAETGFSTSRIVQYDPVGNRRGVIDVPGEVRGDLVLAPDGWLYYRSGSFRRVRNGVVERVGDTELYELAFALDRESRFYHPIVGDFGYQLRTKVVVRERDGAIVTDPFAYYEHHLFDLAFVPAPGGGGSRLVGAGGDGGFGEIIQFNSAGLRAPGPDGPPAFRRAALAAGSAASVGRPYADSVRMEGAGGGGASWMLAAGALPNGVVLTQTGVLTGVPTQSGDFDFSVRGTAGQTVAWGRFTVTVSGAGVDDSLVIVGALREGTVGTAYADTLRATGSGAPVSWSIAGGTLPPGLALGDSNGVVSGIPTDTGTFAFEIRAAAGSLTATADLTMVVRAAGSIVTDDVANAILGDSSAISAAVADSMDRLGNNNGRLDIGDLRAYLRATGQLPSGTSRASRSPRRKP